MTDQATTELIELVREQVPAGSVLEGAHGIELIAELLNEVGEPDFVTLMVAHSGPPQEYAGVAGFREALEEWISPYENFQLHLDELITTDDKIVYLVRQVGKTKHGGVEIETPSATVWALVDGRIAQATFYLDQADAKRAAGIAPDSR